MTHETEALLLGRYALSVERVRPNFSSDGDEDILCSPWRSFWRPLSLAGLSKGIMPGVVEDMAAGDVGVIERGSSVT